MRGPASRLLALLALLLCLAPAAHAGWAEDALTKEANYIADASFSEAATHHADATPSSAGYGAIPDWVQLQESAVAAIGLMGAARQLKLTHQDTARYDAVLGRSGPGCSRTVRAWTWTAVTPTTALSPGAFSMTKQATGSATTATIPARPG